MNITRIAAFAALLSSPLLAQQSPVLVGALRSPTAPLGGLLLLESTAPNLRPVAGTLSDEQNPACLAVDGNDPTTVYAGTFGRQADGHPGPCHVLRLHISGGVLKGSVLLNATPLHEDYIHALVPLGDHVYFLGRNSIGAVPSDGGRVVRLADLPDRADPRGMTSDGRFLFIALNHTGIFFTDLATPTGLQLLVRINRYPDEQIQNLAIDNAGDLLVVTSEPTRGARLLRIDAFTGRQLEELSLPLLGARAVAQDPVSGTTYVAGARADSTSGVVIVKDGKVVAGPLGNLGNATPALVVMQSRNLYRRGVACTARSGASARIDVEERASTRRPLFGVTLQAPPGSPAVLSMGTAVPLIDLGPLGAPGCVWGVSVAAVYPLTADSQGRAKVLFPAPTALSIHGQVIGAQWMVAAPGTNHLGFITSALARIVVRD